MNKILYLLLTGIFLFSCSSKNEMEITIENPSSFDRISELIEIPLDSIKEEVKLTDSMVYIVRNNAGEIIPSQITYDRKLIFQPELKSGEAKTFTILTGEVQAYTPKTYGRFITERKDDFAWENDRVAFRVYGPALIASDGPSNGFDIWYKHTNELVINDWYEKDLAGTASYHNDNGQGLDDYKVGRTLGAGAMSPYVNDKLWLNENFAEQEILDNGPLRTTFKLTYNNINVDGNTIAENRIISLDAGSQLSKIKQAYTIKAPMPVAAGIVKRGGNDSIISNDNYIIYAEPESSKVDNIYLALLFPDGIEKTIVDTYNNENAISKKKEIHSHILGVTTQQPKIPIIYYTGYGWSKFGFPTVNDFEQYVKNYSTALQQPLAIKYK